MSELVLFSRQGAVGVITVNNPPVNALSPGVPEGLVEGVHKFNADSDVSAIVIIGGGRTFISGADIKEFAKITSGQKSDIGLAEKIDEIERSAKPVVMAIHGQALGGGLEVAMGGHYRVMARDAKVGQPEVKLGIIPGAAGTQRLPRLGGVDVALEMCWAGEPISAADALKHGIVDAIAEGDLLEFAVQFAAKQMAVRRTCDLAVASFDPAAFDRARAVAAKKSRGLIAAQKAIDAVEAATKLPFSEGVAYERKLFEQCLFDEQSKSMIHVFFGEREVGKIPFLAKDTPLLPIRSAAVIGAGTMGGGIAMNYLNAGIPVRLREMSQEALDRGVATIRKNYAASVAKGRFTQAWMDERLALLTTQLSYDGFEHVDIVVEAVFENMALKKQVFAEIDGVAKAEAILATNTSTLDIDEIASATGRPERVVGHHFFSPANVMRLLEIVRGKATAPEVLATSMALAKSLRKTGVLVGNCFGFVGNRMFGPYRREAEQLVIEGASPMEVDRALYDWGMAMGPIAVGDLAGLDIGWRIRQERGELGSAPIEDELCAMGRFGQKTGAGWYRYDANRNPSPDPEVDAVIEKHRTGHRVIPANEIVDRCVGVLIDEGKRILEEGIALRPVDIDIVYVMGYGFPAYRGGPMWFGGVGR
ncbi:MAG: 3-hydroxyacyl-CoA dehydrogenase NAD-binding domain-containing protein [Bryobacteraceae bacterium]|nr:3-hydroxyacyl-CoA dehydrogenase NAD-binding domain-containing protein [Bryobacteraceae bacterium]